MIIITGMDNSGKTTLCQQLSQLMHLPIIHSAGPELTSDEKKVWTLNQLSQEYVHPNLVIFDRFMPLEEMVYGPILRGHSDFDFNDPFIDSLYERNPVIIYTRPDRETILTDNGRNQMEGVMANGEKLLQAWDELIFRFMATGWNVLVYNWRMGPFNSEALFKILKSNKGER